MVRYLSIQVADPVHFWPDLANSEFEKPDPTGTHQEPNQTSNFFHINHISSDIFNLIFYLKN